MRLAETEKILVIKLASDHILMDKPDCEWIKADKNRSLLKIGFHFDNAFQFVLDVLIYFAMPSGVHCNFVFFAKILE